MSSHHIVRENQEPALVVADYQALDTEQLGQLLEWSPFIVTDTANFDFFLAEGIKVDVVFGASSVELGQEATKFMPLPDDSDLIQEALVYLIKDNFKAVNILSTVELPRLKRFVNDISIVIYSQGVRCAFFHGKFEKWKPEGEKIFLDESTIKSFQGLDYLQNGEFVTYADGFVTVEFSTEDWVLVGEAL